MYTETSTPNFNQVQTYNPKINEKTNRIDRKGFRNQGAESDNERQVIISESEGMYLDYLMQLKRELNAGARTKEISQIIETLSIVNNSISDNYVESILYPESARGAKIPSVMPLPSASFQLRQSFNVSTNANGNAAVMINPFYLATTATNSTVCVNNNVALDGISTSNFFLPVAIGQDIPAVYNQYRLVSGSLIVKYIGRLDIVQGIIGGAIIYDPTLTASVTGTPVAGLAKYGNFNSARDSYFNQECYALQGIRELYFPLDTSFEEYLPLGTSKGGFNYFVYIQNCPPSTASFKFDLTLNFECLADSAFLNYIPTSTSTQGRVDRESLQRRIKPEVVQPESSNVWKQAKSLVGSGVSAMFDSLFKKGLSSLANLL